MTILFLIPSETIGPIACSMFMLMKFHKILLTECYGMERVIFNFPDFVKKSFKNFIHSFVTETEYIFMKKIY